MESSIFEWLTRFMYEQCGFLCHQLESRSIMIAGVPLPVCSRCTGIYAGALFAFLIRIILYRWNVRPQMHRWIYGTTIATLVFLLFDVYAGYRIYGDQHPVRYTSGYLFGFMIFFLIGTWIKSYTVDPLKEFRKPVSVKIFFAAMTFGLSLSVILYIFCAAEPWFFYFSLSAVFTGIWVLYSAANTLIFFWIFSNLRRRCSSALCFRLSQMTGVVLFVIQMMFIQWAGLTI